MQAIKRDVIPMMLVIAFIGALFYYLLFVVGVW